MLSSKSVCLLTCRSTPILAKCLSTTPLVSDKSSSYKLVIVGGGAGGCATGAKFSSKLGSGQVAIIEPSDTHYYQPMWTLVGGGMKTVKESARPMSKVLPSNAVWIKQKAVKFKPEQNKVITEDGIEIKYEFLVVAMGLQLNYSNIKGLPEAFNTPGVASNYSHLYVDKTFEALQNFKSGNAIFSFPNTPVKCAGAPQKIMYISEEYLKKTGKKEKANIMFNTATGVLFGVKKYADALWKVVDKRDIQVNLQHNLIEVNPDKKEAIFEILNEGKKTVSFPYEMLHVTPPMSAPDALSNTKSLVDQTGFLDLDKGTLQHKRFPNIFGIGDCTNLPTSKTAAAVAGEIGVLRKNLSRAMKGEKLTAIYDGYTSCPLVTGYSFCILAEFDYDGTPLETFPINQAKERRTMFHMKKDMMPPMYWYGLLNGYWEGPKYMRKIFHLGFSK